MDTASILGGNPIIDDEDNVIYNLRWTFTPLDPNEPGASFIGRTSFDAGRGTYQLIISDGTCESEPIDFVFSGEVDILSISGLLTDEEVSQPVSCELGAQDGRISIQISGGQEPYDITWELLDPTQISLTPPTGNFPNNPWIELPDYRGFTTLNDLAPGLYDIELQAVVAALTITFQ